MQRTEGHVMNIDDLDISPELKEKARACKTPNEMLALAKKEGVKVPDEDLERIAGGQGWELPDCPNCGSSKTHNNGSGYGCKACGHSWS